MQVKFDGPTLMSVRTKLGALEPGLCVVQRKKKQGGNWITLSQSERSLTVEEPLFLKWLDDEESPLTWVGSSHFPN